MTLIALFAPMAQSTNRSTAKRRHPPIPLPYVTSPGAPGATALRADCQTPPRGVAPFILLLDVRGGRAGMTAASPQGDEPLIPMPALSLPALRQAIG